MSNPTTPASASSKQSFVDPTKLGDSSAVQPLSGVTRVDETFAVNGLGRGGYVRKEDTSKAKGSA
jgi:hypothetical protein